MRDAVLKTVYGHNGANGIPAPKHAEKVGSIIFGILSNYRRLTYGKYLSAIFNPQ